MKLVIDLFSKNWVHKDFNIQFLRQFTGKEDIVFGNEGAEYLKSLRNDKIFFFKGWRDFYKLIQLLICAEDVVFLVLMNKYIPLVFFSILLGKKTSFIVHKYNLTTRKRRKFVNILYQILERIGLISISFEEIDSIFLNNKIIELDMWENTQKVPLKKGNHISKIAFIGKPIVGKNFDLLLSLRDKYNFEVYLYCDEPLNIKECVVVPFKSAIDECDLIWGYYDPKFYKGIQSGLCYPSLNNGLRVITNNNMGFVYFSKIYPNHTIKLCSLCELEKFIMGEL
ncbi:hypothetical protein SAMN02745753_04441 [Marinomonas polaris DSM 16579]|uniref:Uncharacterized protein n=1 Tax=Marinomonas polaris DSM 16579 TaxID=1122206 RepID=A0A1M5MD61_9GAMM|nr:hypothetical protein [Marinomonas polaris]SHG75187.1 hypothetical protein SAMN02745753_04441 [Marinomonas polaris DSM 16579]